MEGLKGVGGNSLGDRKRLLVLLGIMAGVAMAVAMLSVWLLYQAAFNEQRKQLYHLVESEVQEMKNLAGHFKDMGMSPETVREQVTKQISANHTNIEGFAETGELLIGRLKDDKIIYSFGLHKSGKHVKPPIPIDSQFATPMRRALEGHSGTVIGLDHRGVEVMAAYKQIKPLKLGIVAKINIAELCAPFVRAGTISGAGAVLVILLGTILFRRISTPLVENMETAVARMTEAQRIARLGNWERDIKTGEGWWSEETYRIYGLEPAEISPTIETLLDCIHPDDRDKVKSAINKCQDGKEPYSVEFRIIRPDGTQRIVHGRGTWRLGKNGKPERISGTVQDITQRRQVEDNVHSLAAAIESLSENFALYGPDDRLIMCNERHRRLNKDVLEFTETGVLFEDHLRALLKKGLVPDAIGREEEWIQQRMERRRNPAGPFEILRQDGHWYSVHDQRMPDGSTATISTDITVRKQAEENLRQALGNVEEANRAKSIFLANMSHELRTPLNSIIGFSETLKSQLFGPLGTPRYTEYAGDINASGRHLLEVINDILDISKIEAGEIDLTEEEVDLPVLVEAAITMLREQAENQGIILSRIFPSDCPRIVADPRHIKQIVINLVSNAVKFTPAKGTIKLEILVEDMRAVSFFVEDTGIGIKSENITKVLEPFGQIGNVYSRTHEGTGLGLPLAKSLIELHGGTLKIDSEFGKGTKVSIQFPSERTVVEDIPLGAAGE